MCVFMVRRCRKTRIGVRSDQLTRIRFRPALDSPVLFSGLSLERKGWQLAGWRCVLLRRLACIQSASFWRTEIPCRRSGWFWNMYSCVCVVCVVCFLPTRMKVVPKPLWVNDYFDLFLWAVELAFIRLCGLHLKKHPSGDLSQMRDCGLVDLGQDSVRHLMYYTLL